MLKNKKVAYLVLLTNIIHRCIRERERERERESSLSYDYFSIKYYLFYKMNNIWINASDLILMKKLLPPVIELTVILRLFICLLWYEYLIFVCFRKFSNPLFDRNKPIFAIFLNDISRPWKVWIVNQVLINGFSWCWRYYIDWFFLFSQFFSCSNI